MTKKIDLCKGGCGNKAIYKGWCGIKWKKGNRVCVACPELERKRGEAISVFRIKEARMGLNPMQNPEICRKNHSLERNIKAAQSLKKLGQLGLLPQQTESESLRRMRLARIRYALRKLAKEKKLNHQVESVADKIIRHQKISKTLRELGRQGKLPAQNLTPKEKLEFEKKISITMRKKFKNGELKLNNWGKIYDYRSSKNGKVIFRSKWEREVAELFDRNDIQWQYEPKVVSYFDRERNRLRNTVPDFYIPDMNLFVEIKSNAEFNSQNTQDKVRGIKNQGYKLILFGKKQIKAVREDPLSVVSQINDYREKD